ncbi:hypothetical protein [Paraburkholderia sp. D1E]|uniref:hypothetical protein n=1 Tax=Paraburkholderia sp. D1E TaxID=3461398 RepID=UPI00404593C2
MKKLYAQLVLFLIKPALKLEAEIEFAEWTGGDAERRRRISEPDPDLIKSATRSMSPRGEFRVTRDERMKGLVRA